MTNCGSHGPYAIDRDAAEHAEDGGPRHHGQDVCIESLRAVAHSLRGAAREAARALRGLGCGANDTRESRSRLAVAVPPGAEASKWAHLRDGDAALVRLAAVGVTPEER